MLKKHLLGLPYWVIINLSYTYKHSLTAFIFPTWELWINSLFKIKVYKLTTHQIAWNSVFL